MTAPEATACGASFALKGGEARTVRLSAKIDAPGTYSAVLAVVSDSVRRNIVSLGDQERHADARGTGCVGRLARNEEQYAEGRRSPCRRSSDSRQS